MIRAKMTPETYEQLAGKLWAEAGLELAGRDGTLSKDGVTASYHYDGAELQIEVTKHPFFLGKDLCENKIRQALATQGCAAE